MTLLARRLAVLVATLLYVVVLPRTVVTSEPTASQIKAAFLYQFGHYVEWPARALPPGSPIVLAVLGPDPFGEDLDRVLAGKLVRGRALVLRRIPDAGAASGSHILFIGSTKDLPSVLKRLSGSAVLTVGDGLEFARAGGMIGLYAEDDRIRLAVNVEAATRSGLAISSQLLKLSKVVTP